MAGLKHLDCVCVRQMNHIARAAIPMTNAQGIWQLHVEFVWRPKCKSKNSFPRFLRFVSRAFQVLFLLFAQWLLSISRGQSYFPFCLLSLGELFISVCWSILLEVCICSLLICFIVSLMHWMSSLELYACHLVLFEYMFYCVSLYVYLYICLQMCTLGHVSKAFVPRLSLSYCGAWLPDRSSFFARYEAADDCVWLSPEDRLYCRDCAKSLASIEFIAAVENSFLYYPICCALIYFLCACWISAGRITVLIFFQDR